MKPSVGRVVHYVSAGSMDGRYPSVCRAAIITEVSETGDVGLCVLNPTGQHFRSLAEGGNRFDERGPIDEDGTPLGGTWHWPERVE